MSNLSDKLLAWYDSSARKMPWRETKDPYRIWVSEIMLQQTRVDTVIPHYLRFIEHFPDIVSLAEANEADVLKQWEGLGYYSRARNLLNGAKQVCADYGGLLPADPDKLKKISGIGPYTAGAISSIAFQQKVPAVDGNVIRVISRVFGIRDNTELPSVRKQIDDYAASMVPDNRPGDYNQAVMDLGATICVPGTPDCDRCPATMLCNAFYAGDAEMLPVHPSSSAPAVIPYHLLLILSDGRVLMRRRKERLLQGLWCFPMLEEQKTPSVNESSVKQCLNICVGDIQEAGNARHVFTHRIWQMKIYSMSAAPGQKEPSGYSFIPVDKLKELAIPTAMHAALSVLSQKTAGE